jgi:diguanylate cyclase (GGDEF)-like protein/PAS domain S-box-containing protein
MQMDRALFNAILDTVSDGVYIVDHDRRIRHWNRGAEAVTGFSPEQVLGTTCGETMLCHVSEDGRVLCTAGCPLDATLKTGKPHSGHVYLRHRDGHRIPVTASSTPIFDASGAVTGAVEVFHEETAELAAAERIRQLRQVALLDPLTRLGNRRYTRMMLSSRLDELRRYGWRFGLLFIDVDHFKNVNDAHGHETGDKALRTVASTLMKSLRPFDFLGRWAGDEFLALIVNVGSDELAGVAERARSLVEQTRIEDLGRRVALTVSIGAALARAEDTVDHLVSRADALMYESKLAGRNQIRLQPPDQASGAAQPAAGPP